MMMCMYPQVLHLSTHPVGHFVVECLLQKGSGHQKITCLYPEIMGNILDLAKDQYGEHVIEALLRTGKLEDKKKVINALRGKIWELSRHKHARYT